MPAIKDITNQKFGRLTVIAFAGIKNHKAHWHCICECGTERIVCGEQMTSGRTKSCGCYILEKLTTVAITHGRSLTPEWRSWIGMRTRCLNPNSHQYADYGGRGITVCSQWINSFEQFYADMGPKPSPRHSLERIDNHKGYEPENCRWATTSEQARNRRSNVFLTIDGVTKMQVEWAEVAGISRSLLCKRLAAGWNPRDAIFKPSRTKHHKPS